MTAVALVALAFVWGWQQWQIERLRKRLDATQNYHSARIWQRLYALEGNAPMARAYEGYIRNIEAGRSQWDSGE